MSDLGNKDVIAQNIRYYMELNKKDRNQICNDLGFKYSTFTDWVNAKKYPRIDKIEMMANYFGINKSDLVEKKPVNQEINELTEKDYEYIERIKKFGPEKQRLLDIFLTGLEHDQ